MNFPFKGTSFGISEIDNRWKFSARFHPGMNYRGRNHRYVKVVTTRFPLATAAALIADPARASMLMALVDGGALAAGELARR